MRTRNVVHKGLCRFIKEENTSEIQPVVIQKIQRIVSFLQHMEQEEEWQTVASWRRISLTEDRRGSWSLFVTQKGESRFALIGQR
jgi:proteic killer suppression protein